MVVHQFSSPGFSSAVQGFAMMLSLIVAIGAQNTFLLRQAILRAHVTPLVLICWLSDVTLVFVGVTGVGVVVERLPAAVTVIRICAAVVLLGYAAMAVRRVITGESLVMDGRSARRSVGSAVLSCLAITWLNPHVYLDTVLMIGGVANSHGYLLRWWFAAGSIVASIAWFAALGYGAGLLQPLFRNPRSWRILDSIVAVIMIATAARLLLSMP